MRVGGAFRACATSNPDGSALKNLSRRNFKRTHYPRRSIQEFEALLSLCNGFGFSGPWTVVEQNRLLGLRFGLSQVNGR